MLKPDVPVKFSGPFEICVVPKIAVSSVSAIAMAINCSITESNPGTATRNSSWLKSDSERIVFRLRAAWPKAASVALELEFCPVNATVGSVVRAAMSKV